ncbi:hypothetical protein PQR34_46815 [Paraburkholderia sediminicola]|uniref:hypothetical protein n=1 Tax=Paraburkholderia sediminicola TaxID=458836 RepID=UPI0038BDE8EF
MTKAGKSSPAVTQELVLAKLMPGSRHSLHEIAGMVGFSAANVRRVLADCVVKGTVKMKNVGRKNLYWAPAADEDGCVQPDQWAHPREVLRGYDTVNNRFRELCLASRAVSASPNRSSDSETQ